MRLPNNSQIAHGFTFCNDLATVKNMTFLVILIDEHEGLLFLVAQKNTKMVGGHLISVYPGPL